MEEVIRYANAEGTCPYMCSIEAAREADVIVLDYNHVFVESVSQSSLPSMSIEIGSTLIIIDEAHNLPDRIKMGLEMRLTEKGMRAARFELEEYLESRVEHSASEDSLDQISNLIGWLNDGVATQLLELLHRLVLDIAFYLLELFLHSLTALVEGVTHLLLFIIEWSLHYFSEQHEAQVLQLRALLVV